MKLALLFSIMFSGTVIATCQDAQDRWNVYLGAGQDSLYHFSPALRIAENNVSCIRFEAFPKVKYQSTVGIKKVRINRDGVLLPAKSTTDLEQSGTIVFGNSTDSVIIFYHRKSIVTRHGRSAAISIFNLFAKGDDKIEQEDPTYDEDILSMKGFISYAGKGVEFFGNMLLLNTDTVKLLPARSYMHRKKTKFKNKGLSSAMELIMNDRVLAAIDHKKESTHYWMLNSLSYEAKLLFTAFVYMATFQVHNLEMAIGLATAKE